MGSNDFIFTSTYRGKTQVIRVWSHRPINEALHDFLAAGQRKSSPPGKS